MSTYNFPQHTLTQLWRLQAAALTDRGQRRKMNEDAVFQFTESTQAGDTIGLYLVCDGMGGHEVGDVASQLAVKTIVSTLGDLLVYEDPADHPVLLPEATSRTFAHWLRDAVVEANETIQTFIDDEPVSKMGTTVNAVLIHNNLATIANVGDSRTYLWRQGEITLLTSDHTVVNEMLKSGTITPEQAQTHPMRHILTQAVGGKEALAKIDIVQRPLQVGDKLLLCTDGLWQAYPDLAELAARMAQAKRPGDLCWQLVTEANQRDGSDNISAVTVYVHGA